MSGCGGNRAQQRAHVDRHGYSEPESHDASSLSAAIADLMLLRLHSKSSAGESVKERSSSDSAARATYSSPLIWTANLIPPSALEIPPARLQYPTGRG